MANPNVAPAADARPAAPAGAKPPVIRSVSRASLAASPVTIISAWLVAATFNGIIIGMGILIAHWITGSDNTVKAGPPPAESDLTDPAEKADLTNPDIGLNPEIPLNYNVDRIEEVSVPGPVDPSAAIGVPGADPSAAIQNVPAPSGFGAQGLNGGLDGPTPGGAAMNNLYGGYGGIANVPGGFAGRSGATREKMLQEGGGNAKSEAAVAAGLLWLATHQSPDGSWRLDSFNKFARNKPTDNWDKVFDDKSSGQGVKNDIAGTAFGLLPFLAAGITHRPNKDKNQTYDYSKQVEMGLNFLIAQQAKNKGGDFGGGMYSHGLATIAMCEAYGLTSDPKLKVSAQAAVNFIIEAQDDKSGGWRYTPKQGGDTSVVGWQVMALKSGQMAGLSVRPETLKGAEKWLDGNMTSDKGDYGYVGNPGTTKDSNATAMTAVGLLCRQYLGWSPRNEGLLNGVSRIKKTPPGAVKSMYYYYYATQVMHHMGGEYWEFWNPKMRDLLISTQDEGKNKATQKGSWDPAGDQWGAQGGRIMVTSLSLLTLEVYYRHLPLYRRDVNQMKQGEEMPKD